MPPTVWTIGHSSRPIESFLDMLRAQRIEVVADVRRYAGSRAHPHFNPEALAHTLERAGVGYLALPELGGRRVARSDSPNTIWRNLAFRGYADYMETAAFQAGLQRFIDAARAQRAALMCAEAVWWRCHRSMIADALKARGIRVLHIMDVDKATEHPYTSAAHIIEGQLVYGPAADQA